MAKDFWMPEPHDGCMQRAGCGKTASGKTAGISLYLMEELGDARLHCAQLTHYIDLARQIIEKSPHKDHIFEVSGHLLQAIPEHLFKLEKSLQAVALAADRMDYEEIKQDLKPDKVEELERILKDVRIRTVPHRSEPLTRPQMNPTQAAEDLQKIATETRTTGKIPVHDVMGLVAALEGQSRTASEATETADMFEMMAKALMKPSSGSPKRLHLAATLRKIVADNLMTSDLPITPQEEEARRSRFEKGQPANPMENMDPEQKKEWAAKNEEHGDNFKEAIDRTPAQFIGFLERMVGGVEEAAKQMRHSLTVYKQDTGKNSPQLGNFYREVASLSGQMRVLERSMPKDIVFASKTAIDWKK